jgi:hypothetical protein
MVAAADRAGVATADLPAVRARLLAQQSRLMEESARTGAALAALVPTASEIAAVGPALGDLSEAAVARTVRTMYSTLDAGDAALAVPAPIPAGDGETAPAVLSGPSEQPGQLSRPAAPSGPSSAATLHGASTPTAGGVAARVRGTVAFRNATVYGSYSAIVLTVQVGLFLAIDEVTLALTGPLCLLALPALAWLAGYLTIGVAFQPPAGRRGVDRTPRLGAIVCAVPDAVLVAAVVVLFAVHALTG